MGDLEQVLKQVLYTGVGAVATIVEKSGDVVQSLCEKGQETIEANRPAVEEWAQKVKTACENAAIPNVSNLNRQQRETLRRQLDEVDAKEAEEETAAHSAAVSSETAEETPAQADNPVEETSAENKEE